MQEDKTILIIPDIHGRDFWKDGVEQRLPGEPEGSSVRYPVR